jgi:putative flippase GtrA
VSAVDSVLIRIPQPYRDIAMKHHELVKFGLVGASTFFIDTGIFYLLKWTILASKPVSAKVFAVLVATVVSYVLNREWSFRTRGGRERHHEATLYFLISGISVAFYSAPLWISRYVLHLEVPFTTRLVEEIADFASGQIIGLLLGMAFRWWAFRKWVFPDQDVRPRESTRETTSARL